MFRLTRVIVRLRSEPFGFCSIITYSFWRLLVGDTSRRAQKPVPRYSFVWTIRYRTILRCVWIERRLDEYYAVPYYYKYRKRKWSAAETSEPKCVLYVELTWYWNIKRIS
jgi:hypothetical protein